MIGNGEGIPGECRADIDTEETSRLLFHDVSPNSSKVVVVTTTGGKKDRKVVRFTDCFKQLRIMS